MNKGIDKVLLETTNPASDPATSSEGDYCLD